jgi:hypothetical protein
MSLIRGRRRGWVSLAAAMVIGGLALPAAAQDQAASNPNPGAIHITGATDFTNAYMFRGIRQDDTRVITWPYFDLGLALYSGGGAVKSAAVDFGTWNSIHSGDTGARSNTTGLGCACGKAWYESDFYTTLGLGFGGGTSLATTYTAYTSPNNGFSTVKELAFKLAVDDSGSLGKAALKPYALFAFEFNTAPGQGQADGGLKAGRYVELGVGPGYSASRASVAVPIKVGLSASNYYELSGVDHKFGYFSIAPNVTVPLTSKPTKFGTWNVHGGVEYQRLGESTKVFNNGDANRFMVVGGIGFTY